MEHEKAANLLLAARTSQNSIQVSIDLRIVQASSGTQGSHKEWLQWWAPGRSGRAKGHEKICIAACSCHANSAAVLS